MKPVLERVSNTMNRHHDFSNTCEGKYLIGAELQFKMFSLFSHGGKQVCIKKDVVLEEELKVLKSSSICNKREYHTIPSLSI